MAPGNIETLAKPRVLLTGASSQIGVFAVPRLLAAGFRISALSRGGKPANFPEYEEVDWISPEEVGQAAESCQFFVSAGPMKLAQEILETCTSIRTMVVFSSSSVVSKRESGDRDERVLMAAMLASETRLGTLAEKLGINFVILKPTLVYGCGLDNNISRLASMIRRFGFLPVNGRASGLRQPVHADDLAKLAISSLLYTSKLPCELLVSGGSTLSYREMVSAIFKALDKPVRLLRLPQWVFVALVRLLGVLDRNTGVNSEMVKRQLVDLVFDDREARELLGHQPRLFTPSMNDFYLPDSDRVPEQS